MSKFLFENNRKKNEKNRTIYVLKIKKTKNKSII